MLLSGFGIKTNDAHPAGCAFFEGEKMEIFVTILELIGTVAFSASGALTAMKKRMDLLGVIVLGVLTAVGGGIMRDIILGVTPPMAFRDPLNVIVAIVTAAVFFFPAVRHRLMRNHVVFDIILLIMDSIGLGIFTVMGIWITLDFSPDRSTFLLLFVGVITGVGGGVLRDILAGNTPYILVKHVYACASLAGAIACVLLLRCLPNYIALILSVLLVLIIRLLSAHFHWNLPRATDV